jgi:heme/copper-type cytochrome/quinol oxidase subunit 3
MEKDRKASSFSLKRGIIYSIAIVVALFAIWIGSYFYFIHSSTWEEARSLIMAHEKQPTSSAVLVVSPRLYGFSYRSSGDYESFGLEVNVDDASAAKKYRVSFERTNGVLRIVSMIPD